ncbi:MAG: hypothetical protein ABIW79_01080 [Gemmatimonas sp.]
MSSGPRAYLVDRFRTDATALRQRAAALRAAPRSIPPAPGPTAELSERMAAACDDVVAMLDAISEGGDPAMTLSSISALSPLLELRAQRESEEPAVRAVYAGAATRIREVQQVEASARDLLA